MPGVTGIELGPDCCVLVRGGRLGAHRTVAAAATIGTLAFSTPRDRPALVERLREARRNQDLPTRARVVAWGDGSSVAPLVEAGFDVGAVLTPRRRSLASCVRARWMRRRGRRSPRCRSTRMAPSSPSCQGQSRAFGARSNGRWARRSPARLGTTRSIPYRLARCAAARARHRTGSAVYGVTVTTARRLRNRPNLRSLATLHRRDGPRGRNAGLGRAPRSLDGVGATIETSRRSNSQPRSHRRRDAEAGSV